MPTFEAPRPGTSDEEEEEEEEEMQFKIDEKKDNKPWWSVNKCVAAAVILLFLGSLFFSGEFHSHITALFYQHTSTVQKQVLLCFNILCPVCHDVQTHRHYQSLLPMRFICDDTALVVFSLLFPVIFYYCLVV